jgi:putative heme-binding domain-containing protein
LDLTSGRDRGRIYRIAPPDYRHRPTPDLSRATTAELVELLAHPNVWHRETASRLLYQRQDAAAAGPLGRLAAAGEHPLGRLHARYALAGLRALTADQARAALDDLHPRVREHAVRIAEAFIDDPAVFARLTAMIDDPDMRVRYQLAFTLGESNNPGRTAALASILKRDGMDRWMRVAALSSMSEGAGTILARLVDDESMLASSGGRSLLEVLARQAAMSGSAAEAKAAVEAWMKASAGNEAAGLALLRGLEGLKSKAGLRGAVTAAGGPAAGSLLDAQWSRLKATATHRAAGDTQRAQAARMLSMLPPGEARPLLLSLLAPAEPQAVQLAALAAMGSLNDPAVAGDLLDRWSGLSPAMRGEVMETLMARPERVAALLEAIEQGRFPVADLNDQRIQQLKGHAKLDIRKRAAAALASVKLATRGQVVQEYRAKMAGLKGDAGRGKTLFTAVCSACHKLEGVGNEIGPNLAQFAQQKGADAVVLNLVDPNAEVNPLFVLYLVTTQDGRTLSGMITAETAGAVTLNRGAGAEEVLPRAQIKSMQSTGRSLMPEGMEAALGPQGTADVIEYLMSVK